MGKLVLLRHGESVWNKKNIFTGWVNVALSEQGVMEALEAGEKMADIAFDGVYVSKLVRAQMTALIALSKNRSEKTFLFPSEYVEWGKSYGEQEFVMVREAEALNERYYGQLQGKNKQEVQNEFGEEQFRLWRRSYSSPPPEGESLEMTVQRVIPFFQKEIVPLVQKGDTILVCAHGNSIRGIVMHLEHLSPENVAQLEIPTGVPLSYDLSR